MKCCELKAGHLIHRIIIEQPVETPDGIGGSSVVWTQVAEIRAKVKPVSGSERLWAKRKEADITHKIYTRYANWLTPDMRVNFNGRIMEIDAVINMEERNRWIEITAFEGKPT
jgi:SPP1 family predicted phage head-tail adaptor